MAENLNYAYLQPTEKLDSSSFCYEERSSQCEKFGRLYLWSAAMDSAGVLSDNGKGCGLEKSCSPEYPVSGVCPEGWHLPDVTEWKSLLSLMGVADGNYFLKAGLYLKSSSGWYSGNWGFDSFGFSVLHSGYRYGSGDYYDSKACLWSSTEDFYMRYAYSANFSEYGSDVVLGTNSKNYGCSVRCVKN